MIVVNLVGPSNKENVIRVISKNTILFSRYIYKQFPQVYCLSTKSRGILHIQHNDEGFYTLNKILVQVTQKIGPSCSE